MSKRFGRNQKRRLKAELQKIEVQAFVNENKLCREVMQLKRQIQEMQPRVEASIDNGGSSVEFRASFQGYHVAEQISRQHMVFYFSGVEDVIYEAKRIARNLSLVYEKEFANQALQFLHDNKMELGIDF